MYLLGLGIVLLVLKWQQIGMVADWSWWWVAAPFAGASLWWAWSDWSGWTKRKQVERENLRRLERINRRRRALGQKEQTRLPPDRLR